MALTVTSIYTLFVLCSDLVYVILFPQLCCVIYFKHSNTYGCLSGYLTGLTLRVLGGETKIGLPAIIEFPLYEVEYGQLFPYRSLCMLVSLTTIIVVSYGTKLAFEKEFLPYSMDFLRCYSAAYDMAKQLKNNEIPLEDKHEHANAALET